MTISTIGVAAAVAPTVVKSYVSHYANRKPRRQKPTAHISYDEGLHLIRAFLDYASHHTVEDLQAFTAQWVPHPRWVKVDSVVIPLEYITKAAGAITLQLGNRGVDKIGGSSWWQWRQKNDELKSDWIEMRGDYNARKKAGEKGRRVMLYVHGGAYFFGSVDEHRYQMQRHARKLQAKVFAPRYRLAPQFPFPCGLLDCLAAYLFLLTIHDPTEIVLAGDSAGAGMAVSMLCIVRDQGLPLPAGAILISPWVDLTHSFPSVAGNCDFDYIPTHGFMQKPSASWPPPNDDEMAAIAKGAISQVAGETLPRKSTSKARKSAELEALQSFVVYHDDIDEDEAARKNPNNPTDENDPFPIAGNTIPGPGHQLSIEIDGNMVFLKDQIQMYATNQLISHPLVSPILQPSLGGLPPLLILTGGGEVLRDEQIYLAHKAANPAKYPLGAAYKAEYDPEDSILHKYKPTPVQIQVWDDLCHVAPTLSFTRPAKYMYRSVAQFGAWALARAQKRSIEIVDDDDISVISSGSDTETESDESTDSLHKQKSSRNASAAGRIGRAGDPLPPFKSHMIRQRVDRNGTVFPLAPSHELQALNLSPSDIGVIKPAPVRKWLAAKKEWDAKYAYTKRRVQKQRVKDLSTGGPVGFGTGECPPPSALAGRRKKGDMSEVQKKGKKSMGLAIWSLWGSKHDEHTIKREEEAVEQDRKMSVAIPSIVEDREQRERKRSRGKSGSGIDDNTDASRSRSRRRTITVTDIGQTEGLGGQGAQLLEHDIPPLPVDANQHLTPLFIPKFKAAPHLQPDPRDNSDAASTRTGYTGEFDDLNTTNANASTTAVFAAAGVSRPPNFTHSSSLLSPGADHDSEHDLFAAAVVVSPGAGADTPVSRRSVERLREGQVLQIDENGKPELPRSPSTIAVMHVAGISDVVGAEEAADKVTEKGLGSEQQRPSLYERADSEFKTAMEKL